VDETEASFRGLMEHLEVTSNFKPYFEEALSHLLPRCHPRSRTEGMVVLDVGSGVSWTSALLANNAAVRHVYSVEPSRERQKHAEFVLRHFRAPKDKVTLLAGSFPDFTIPEKADCAVLCASFHHCYDEYADSLFRRIKDLLVPGGLILVANEHYVDFRFSMHRFCSFWKNRFRGRDTFYSLADLRTPLPHDGEHWRTRREVENIFLRNGFEAEFFQHAGDLCKEDMPFYRKTGYHYYYAILKQASGRVEER
jgi:SAM-dependent methyltransferase